MHWHQPERSLNDGTHRTINGGSLCIRRHSLNPDAGIVAMGRTEFSEAITSKPGVGKKAHLQLERNGACFRVHELVRSKCA